MNLSYELQFEDGTSFKGKSLSNDWDNAPNKPIKKLVYCFNKKNYVFEDYKEYIHLKENVVSLNGKKGITQIVIIGRKEFESHLLIINFLKKKVYREVVPVNFEYGVWEETNEIIGFGEEDKEPIYKSKFKPIILNGWKKGI